MLYHVLGQQLGNFVPEFKTHIAMEQNNTPAKTQVYNLVILDKSGSMESIRKEAIDGYNETLGAIRAAQLKHMDTQDHFVSLAAFCDCGIDMIYDKTPIKDADKLTKEKYEPCCCTPLFDAIGKSVKKLKTDIKDIEDAAVLVTIITDGYENSSTTARKRAGCSPSSAPERMSLRWPPPSPSPIRSYGSRRRKGRRRCSRTRTTPSPASTTRWLHQAARALQ